MVKIAAWQQCVTKKLSKCIFCSPEISPKCQVLLCVSKPEAVLHVGINNQVYESTYVANLYSIASLSYLDSCKKPIEM